MPFSGVYLLHYSLAFRCVDPWTLGEEYVFLYLPFSLFIDETSGYFYVYLITGQECVAVLGPHA